MFVAVFYWWFVFKPKELVYIYSKLIKKIRQFFSISLLLRTLFSPWKRDELNMVNLSLQDRFRVLMMNLVSRLVGAAVRGGTVFVGITTIVLITAGFFAAILGLILMPIIVIALLFTKVSGGGGV